MKLKIRMLEDDGSLILDATFVAKNANAAAKALRDMADACVAIERQAVKKSQKLAAAAVTLALGKEDL